MAQLETRKNKKSKGGKGGKKGVVVVGSSRDTHGGGGRCGGRDSRGQDNSYTRKKKTKETAQEHTRKKKNRRIPKNIGKGRHQCGLKGKKTRTTSGEVGLDIP